MPTFGAQDGHGAVALAAEHAFYSFFEMIRAGGSDKPARCTLGFAPSAGGTNVTGVIEAVFRNDHREVFAFGVQLFPFTALQFFNPWFGQQWEPDQQHFLAMEFWAVLTAISKGFNPQIELSKLRNEGGLSEFAVNPELVGWDVHVRSRNVAGALVHALVERAALDDHNRWSDRVAPTEAIGFVQRNLTPFAEVITRKYQRGHLQSIDGLGQGVVVTFGDIRRSGKLKARAA